MSALPIGYVPGYVPGYPTVPPAVAAVQSKVAAVAKAAHQAMSSAYFPLIVQCIVILVAPLMYALYAQKNLSCNSQAVKITTILVAIVFILQLLCGVVPFTPLPIVAACTILTIVATVFGTRAFQTCDAVPQKRFLKASLGVFVSMFFVGGATGFLLRRHLGQ